MSALSLVCGGHVNDKGFNDPLLPHLLAAIERTGKGSHIDLCVSFIRQSGLVLLRKALHNALARGASLRVITSDYLDVTEPVALRELLKFDSNCTTALIYQSQGNRGFHLKSYLFIQHDEGAKISGQAFVGSSNVSAAALTDSLEWNWSLTSTAGSPMDGVQHSLEQLHRQVEQLAADPRVVPLTQQWIDKYLVRYQQSSLSALRVLTGDSTSDDEQLREAPIPNAIQQEALTALYESRLRGYKRGVVVMATGLGKTWLSAFDVRQMQAARLLFVAHREEILDQARSTFLRMAPHAQTGFYRGQQQDDADWLFASIQTLGKSNHLQRFAADHFDYIVVDEFHHAASPVYRRLLDHFAPRFLLGLTATPDRTDQADILALCDGNLIFERNLADAIDAHLLVPLRYHGILDETIDYAAIPWRNGQFDPTELNNAFASKKRAQHAFTHWHSLQQSRTLAFCISTRHADFMAEYFVKKGIKAVAVYAGSRQDRHTALAKLASGELAVVFSVDMFNEGTDIPAVDTILMLRPTGSRIVFLQQLGRGLRLHPGKTHLEVIDLVGNHKACLYKPALLEQQLRKTQGTRSVPALAEGCFINLDPALLAILTLLKQSRKHVLLDAYRQLKTELGYRPTALQTWQTMQINGEQFDTRRHGGWFNLLAQEHDLEPETLATFNLYRDFLQQGVETTRLAKSFKLILLQAWLALDGLRQPPTLTALAQHSRYLFERHPALLTLDVPAAQQQLAADSRAWLTYWKNNPIKHSSGGQTGAKADYWFEVRDDRFYPRFSVTPEQIPILHQMVQELLDLRFAQYLSSKTATPKAATLATTTALATTTETPPPPSSALTDKTQNGKTHIHAPYSNDELLGVD
ncbi:MAG: DEAD/DEAH box helicase family protein [Aeromonas sp.]